MKEKVAWIILGSLMLVGWFAGMWVIFIKLVLFFLGIEI